MVLEARKGTSSLVSKIESLIAPTVRSLGYELLDLEYQPKSAGGGPLLRLFIENPNGAPISVDDCSAVDHGLDPVIESPELDSLLPNGFSLEVSSPGIDRPLKKRGDYERFAGSQVHIHTFRPLTVEEMGNAKYFENHKKQKNFFGVLQGIQEEAVSLEADNARITIPIALIAKANLDVARNLTAENDNT